MMFILSMSFGLNLLLIIFTIRVIKVNYANIFLLLLLSLILLGTSYIISLNYLTISYPIIKHFINASPALIGSFTYLYVFYSINSSKRIEPLALIHILPFLVAIILSYYDTLGISVISISLNIGLKIIVSILYFIFSLKTLNTHKINIQNHFSKTDDIDLKWLHLVVKAGLVTYLIYLSILLIWLFDIELFPDIDKYANLVGLIYIFSISYYGISSTKVFIHISKINAEKPMPIENGNDNPLAFKIAKKELMSKEDAEQIYKKMISTIESQKLYMNENLMLEDLAKALDIHSKYLSYVINTFSGKNFFELINHFRILEFNKEVLNPENKNITFLSIAYDCGFGSKSAFSRAYKSEMGFSPSEYIKKQKVGQ